MPPAKKEKTVGDIAREAQGLRQRAAVNMALASMLRTGYLPRDSMSAQKKIACDGAAVEEGVIETVVIELEDGAREMTKAAQSMLGGKVNE